MRFANTKTQTSSKREGRDDREILQKVVSSQSLNLPEGSEKMKNQKMALNLDKQQYNITINRN